MKLAGKLSKEEIILVNLSGRGDKDLDIITSYERKGEIWWSKLIVFFKE